MTNKLINLKLDFTEDYPNGNITVFELTNEIFIFVKKRNIEEKKKEENIWTWFMNLDNFWKFFMMFDQATKSDNTSYIYNF